MRPVIAGQTELVPVIVPGVDGAAGFTTTAKVLAELVPQLLEAVTLIFPFCPALPDVTVIEVVPCPLVIDHPAGTVHTYPFTSAFATDEIL